MSLELSDLEAGDKNWFQRHPVWTGIIGFFLIIMVIGMFSEGDPNSTSITGNVVDEESSESDFYKQDSVNENQNSREYIEEDLYYLIAVFVSDDSHYTDLQKEENFKKYDGKWIRTSGIVEEVDTVWLSDSIVVRLANPENQFLRGATVYFEPSEKEGLLGLSKYDEIQFEGKVEDYGSFMGIIINDAELI